MAQLLFYISAAAVFYCYAGYPLVLLALRQVRRQRTQRAATETSVSIVVSVRNEARAVGQRTRDLACVLDQSGTSGDVIVVSDGSSDGTADAARACGAPNVQVVELPRHGGKAAALNAGCARATGEIVVFADCRQRWAPDAVARLLENFADPSVGAVSGELIIAPAKGVLKGVGLYWRYEKWLRRLESDVFSVAGVSGSICAVRRSLFRPIPPGTLLDDVYWPLRVAMDGYRVVHDDRAIAYDVHPERPRDEFRRKVRTLSGNFQLVAKLPAALLPWRNRVWLQFVSHKLLRLAVPWALVALLVAGAVLHGIIYKTAFWSQVGLYVAAAGGSWGKLAARSRVSSAAASFVMLNAAAWLAFWVWISGRSTRSWVPVGYDQPHPLAE